MARLLARPGCSAAPLRQNAGNKVEQLRSSWELQYVWHCRAGRPAAAARVVASANVEELVMEVEEDAVRAPRFPPLGKLMLCSAPAASFENWALQWGSTEAAPLPRSLTARAPGAAQAAAAARLTGAARCLAAQPSR